MRAIVIATDGSHGSQLAVHEGLELARETGETANAAMSVICSQAAQEVPRTAIASIQASVPIKAQLRLRVTSSDPVPEVGERVWR